MLEYFIIICYLLQVIFLSVKYFTKGELSLTDKVMTVIAPFHIPVLFAVVMIAWYEKR
jgi:positive regulator of sigma E activity